MKAKVLELFHRFYDSSQLPNSIKTSYEVLIPKVSCSSLMSNYKPIALIHGIHKILAKVLANRLQPLLTNLISGN